MDKTTKICKQCGELKPIEQFRKYYGGRKGTYRTCKFCEKINSREKYLRRKECNGTITDTERIELEKIHTLWDYQRAIGLEPPNTNKHSKTPAISIEELDELTQKYAKRAKDANVSAETPPELTAWLFRPLTKTPEYYQDIVYEELQKKYRPILRIDEETMLPVYDDTYRDILQKILERFNQYEDEYYKDERR